MRDYTTRLACLKCAADYLQMQRDLGKRLKESTINLDTFGMCEEHANMDTFLWRRIVESLIDKMLVKN